MSSRKRILPGLVGGLLLLVALWAIIRPSRIVLEKAATALVMPQLPPGPFDVVVELGLRDELMLVE